jgi:hypothetical protein
MRRLTLRWLLLAVAGCYHSIPNGYHPGPTVTSVAPPTVDIGGGEGLTISGSNFEDGTPNALVTVGNKQCQEVNVVSPSQIKCVTPAFDAEGVVDVKVKNGGSTATRPEASCPGCLTIRDLLGPKITEGFPQQNATVSCIVAPRLKFNEPVVWNGIGNENCYIERGTERVASTCYCSSECTVACEPNATGVSAICIKPDTPLDPDTVYTAHYPCPSDLKGNPAQGCIDAELTLTFRTAAQCGG